MKALIAAGSEWNAIDCHCPMLVYVPRATGAIGVLQDVIAIDTVVTLN